MFVGKIGRSRFFTGPLWPDFGGLALEELLVTAKDSDRQPRQLRPATGATGIASANRRRPRPAPSAPGRQLATRQILAPSSPRVRRPPPVPGQLPSRRR